MHFVGSQHATGDMIPNGVADPSGIPHVFLWQDRLGSSRDSIKQYKSIAKLKSIMESPSLVVAKTHPPQHLATCLFEGKSFAPAENHFRIKRLQISQGNTPFPITSHFPRVQQPSCLILIPSTVACWVRQFGSHLSHNELFTLSHAGFHY